MAGLVSEETRDLLDRADRAISRSRELCAQSKRHITDSRRWLFQMELALTRRRAATYGAERTSPSPRLS